MYPWHRLLFGQGLMSFLAGPLPAPPTSGAKATSTSPFLCPNLSSATSSTPTLEEARHIPGELPASGNVTPRSVPGSAIREQNRVRIDANVLHVRQNRYNRRSRGGYEVCSPISYRSCGLRSHAGQLSGGLLRFVTQVPCMFGALVWAWRPRPARAYCQQEGNCGPFGRLSFANHRLRTMLNDLGEPRVNHFISPITALILTLVLCPSHWASAAAEDEASGQSVEDVLMHGGCGGVYFLAERGELQIALVKRDRNRRSRHTQLRAILVGPDRRVVQERKIPDDGQPRGSGLGPPQWVNFSTRVPRKGVYALNITVSRDRYGREMTWGFRTNCPRYLIETARGHKDERHQEPIVLGCPKMPTDVCFRPRIGAFNLEVSGLSDDVESLRLSRHGDGVVKTVPVRGGEGRGVHARATRARPDTMATAIAVGPGNHQRGRTDPLAR